MGYFNHKLDVMVRRHDCQFLKKDIRKLINHWYLESLTDIQLIQLHMVGSSFRDDYRLGDILQFIHIRGGKLYGLLSTSMGNLCLLNQSITRMTLMPFESKTIRLMTKSTPLFYDSTYGTLSLLGSLTSIQKQHRAS
jgi:hypothetical protein